MDNLLKSTNDCLLHNPCEETLLDNIKILFQCNFHVHVAESFFFQTKTKVVEMF